MIRRYLSVLALALLTVTGCSEQGLNPVSPQVVAAPHAALIPADLDLASVLRFEALPDLTGTRHAEKFIDASKGGTVELNGFRVVIPPNALARDTKITIDLPTDPLQAKHVLVEFGPHGIQFRKPVTISVPLTGVIVPAGKEIEIARWENNAWTSLGGWISADGSRLVTKTPHFSTYSGHVMAGG